jgi:hypothetical protein
LWLVLSLEGTALEMTYDKKVLGTRLGSGDCTQTMISGRDEPFDTEKINQIEARNENFA